MKINLQPMVILLEEKAPQIRCQQKAPTARITPIPRKIQGQLPELKIREVRIQPIIHGQPQAQIIQKARAILILPMIAWVQPATETAVQAVQIIQVLQAALPEPNQQKVLRVQTVHIALTTRAIRAVPAAQEVQAAQVTQAVQAALIPQTIQDQLPAQKAPMVQTVQTELIQPMEPAVRVQHPAHANKFEEHIIMQETFERSFPVFLNKHL